MKTLFLVWSIQARLLRSKESKGGADEYIYLWRIITNFFIYPPVDLSVPS